MKLVENVLALTRKSYRDYLLDTYLGFDRREWGRLVQSEKWRSKLLQLGRIDVLEISPAWNKYWQQLPFKSYKSVEFPEFDICTMKLQESFDCIIADQVFEHVHDPDAAARNTLAMLNDNGVLFVCTPFYVKVHGRPHDYHRWTEDGMRILLQKAGYTRIETDSWGNRACARAYVTNGRYPIMGFGLRRPLANEPEFPIMVWATARR